MHWISLKGTFLQATAASLFSVWVLAQQPNDAGADHNKPNSPAESPVVYQGVRYQSENRRDPFLSPIPQKKGPKAEDEEVSRGLPPPGIGGMNVAQVTLLGIVTQEGGTIAVFRGSDGRAYFLRVGDKLFDGFVSKIGADSVSLVRETTYRSGKVVKQEVTKWLRPQ